jgi:hypothetical protein
VLTFAAVAIVCVDTFAPKWIKSDLESKWDLTVAAVLLSPYLLRAFLPRQASCVQFFEDRLAFSFTRRMGQLRRWHELAELPWSAVLSYQDHHAECVKIRRLGERFYERPWAIPTPTEADRVAVIALLDRFGVRRAET